MIGDLPAGHGSPLFWGAPLIARELETQTFTLAWSQSVTRTRWLAAKLAVGGLAAVAVTEALSLLFTWWAAPLRWAAGHGGSGNSLAMNQFNPLAFATHGITPLGYAAFAFALGVSVGTLIRRTVPTMAATLAIFAAVQIAMPLWIRPNLLPASHTTIAITNDTTLNLYTTDSPHTFTYTLAADGGLPGQPEAWIRSSSATDATGHPVGTALPPACSPAASSVGPWVRPREVPDPPGHPARRHLPARQPVLALAGGRDRHLSRPVPSLALIGYCFWRISRLP
ncbi:MAG: ABC transporter permease subunit [Solirubrobacteraceae bacterium]